MCIALLPIITGCTSPGPAPVPIRLAGAQIAVELVDSWLTASRAQPFQATQVHASFSDRGFQSLLDGTCDLACTDRVIGKRELAEFGARKVEGRRVAFYGYALYINPANPLDSIFAGHLKLIMRGQVTDWKQLAGEQIKGLEGPIHVYGPRKSTRGGDVLARQANIWFADPTWTVIETDQGVIEKVRQDPFALGFASVGYDQGVRCLGLREERYKSPAYPSLEEIESERYILAKVIYIYSVVPPSPAVEAVCDYLYSSAGREAIESTRLWPVDSARALTAAVQDFGAPTP